MVEEKNKIENLIEQMENVNDGLNKVVCSYYTVSPEEAKKLLNETCNLLMLLVLYLKKDYLIVENEFKAHKGALLLLSDIIGNFIDIIWGYQFKEYLKLCNDIGIKLYELM